MTLFFNCCNVETKIDGIKNVRIVFIAEKWHFHHLDNGINHLQIHFNNKKTVQKLTLFCNYGFNFWTSTYILQSLEKWDCSEVNNVVGGLPGISFIPKVGILAGPI